MPPSKLGVVYSHTGIRKFIDAIGASRTRELFFVGRNIDAATALEWGLINAVREPEEVEEESLKIAVEIASGAPLANRGNKRVISAVLRGGTTLAPDVEQEVIELRKSCFSSEDFREGVRAFGEKRRPEWRGR
jgi:enoyl-CoA hydratase/carnithine racemase